MGQHLLQRAQAEGLFSEIHGGYKATSNICAHAFETEEIAARGRENEHNRKGQQNIAGKNESHNEDTRKS